MEPLPATSEQGHDTYGPTTPRPNVSRGGCDASYEMGQSYTVLVAIANEVQGHPLNAKDFEPAEQERHRCRSASPINYKSRHEMVILERAQQNGWAVLSASESA